MSRPALEVADIFRDHGAAWREANRGHVSLAQLKVMSAIESCRTAALGGHVARCEDCAHTTIAYNSCRNRHCPKCQGAAAREWMEERQAELLPVPYFHIVFTLPSAIGDIAYQNKAAIYDLLFKAGAETLLTIAAGRTGSAAVLLVTERGSLTPSRNLPSSGSEIAPDQPRHDANPCGGRERRAQPRQFMEHARHVVGAAEGNHAQLPVPSLMHARVDRTLRRSAGGSCWISEGFRPASRAKILSA